MVIASHTSGEGLCAHCRTCFRPFMAQIIVLSTLEKCLAHVELRKPAGSHERHIGYSTRLECERARRNDTLATKMRAGSHGRSLRELNTQNASGLARMPTFRMQASKHERHPRKLTHPKCERALTSATAARGGRRHRFPMPAHANRYPKTHPATRPPGIHARRSQSCLEQVIQFFIQFFYEAKVIEKEIG